MKRNKPIRNNRSYLGNRWNWESLESRQMLSVSVADPIAHPYVTITPDAHGSSAASSIDGYTPAQIKAAYGFSQISFNGVAGDGTGQTIAIVDAFSDPNIASNLATFDTQFGLSAPPSFKQVSQTGSSKLPQADQGWAGEIALDVEWAHAIAPKANILLVDTTDDSISNLVKGVNYARNAAGVSVVSMSWGGSEFAGQTKYDQYFTTPAGHIGVTFLAASGDEGARGGAEWPASSPNVVAVGGTSLSLTGSTYETESAWSDTSGGTSRIESTPTYQSALSVTGRTTADVSYDADPDTGVAVYDTYGGDGWSVAGGTSAGTPQWGALIAIADQGRTLKGAGTLDGATGTLPALYNVYSNATTYAADFNDIATGSNGSGGGGGFGGGGFGGGFGGFGGFGWHHRGGSSGSSAVTGYDTLTGLGTPKAENLVQSLASAGVAKAAKVTKTTVTAKTVRLKHKDIVADQRGSQPVVVTLAVAQQITPIILPSLERSEPRADVETAVGLARPATLAAVTADDSAQTSLTLTSSALSGFVAENALLRGAVAAAEHVAQSTAAVMADATAGARIAAVELASVSAPALHVPQQLMTYVHLDAAAFGDAISHFAEESAAMPPSPTATAGISRAWVVTGAVIVADAILIARYQAKRRKSVFNGELQVAGLA